MKYFGPEKYRKPEEEQIPVPLDHKCHWCEEAFTPDDMGTSTGENFIHYECGIRGVVGSVGHQKGACSCYGGTEEDPPGMTKREAAVAATTYYHFKGTQFLKQGQ